MANYNTQLEQAKQQAAEEQRQIDQSMININTVRDELASMNEIASQPQVKPADVKVDTLKADVETIKQGLTQINN